MLDAKVKVTPLSKDQTARIAFQTCQWWRAVFVQGKRFLDVFDSDEVDWPWDDNEDRNAYNVERLLLITTIHHAIEHLEVLNDELMRRGDNSLNEVYQKVCTVSEKLNMVRNVNEHQLEYIVLPEKNAEKFFCTATKNGISLNTNRLQTILLGKQKIFTIGDVDFGELLINMKEQYLTVKRVTESIFYGSVIEEKDVANKKDGSIETVRETDP